MRVTQCGEVRICGDWRSEGEETETHPLPHMIYGVSGRVGFNWSEFEGGGGCRG